VGNPTRLHYLDWMRGLAILIMLQGHAVHSWMRDDLRRSDFFELSQLVAGLPAAMFLFMTGISLVILLRGRGGFGWRQVGRRAGYILGIALLFRLQQWAFYWPHSSARDLLKADILNSMGVALGLAGGLMVVTPERWRAPAAGLAALAVAMATPLVWKLPAGPLPGFLMGYLVGSPQTANFPLFPWASYAFTGVMAGLLLLGRKERPELDRAMQWMVLAALTLLVAARFFDSIPFSYYQPYNYWLTSPNLVANRTAVVLLLLALSYGWTSVAAPERFSWVCQMGRTSLLIYWVHIELVYGRFLAFPQHRLDAWEAAAAVACLMGAMLLLSLARTRWRGFRVNAWRLSS